MDLFCFLVVTGELRCEKLVVRRLLKVTVFSVDCKRVISSKSSQKLVDIQI